MNLKSNDVDAKWWGHIPDDAPVHWAIVCKQAVEKYGFKEDYLSSYNPDLTSSYYLFFELKSDLGINRFNHGEGKKPYVIFKEKPSDYFVACGRLIVIEYKLKRLRTVILFTSFRVMSTFERKLVKEAFLFSS